jgi:hypothetical protein
MINNLQKDLVMLKRTLLSCALSLTSFAAMNAHADETNPSAWSLTPQWGRAQFSAASGDANLGIFGGDVMQPLLGDANHFVYGDVAGDYATDDTYVMSPGIGYRGVYNNQIWGAYAFSDDEKTSAGENFWVLSPGVEWMSPHWDAHVNLYFPTNHSQASSTSFASDNGRYNYVAFEAGTNNQYDMMMQYYDVIGNGADTEVGYRFAGKDNLSSRVYAGIYYYQPQGTQNIFGGTLGVEQALSQHVSLAVFNSYDEVNHYAAGISLTLTLGGNANQYSHDVSDRLLDPVERHVGIIDTGAGTYDQQTSETLSQQLQYDNVYFISENGTGDGTYGNAADLSQTTLDNINSNDPNGSRVYIQGNSTYTVNGENMDSAGVTINNGGDLYTYYGLEPYANQDFYGRTTDYTAPASASEQPLIVFDDNSNDAFILTNGGENTFSDLNIQDSLGNYGNKDAIMLINESGDANLTVSDVTITGAQDGIYVFNTGGTVNLDVQNSTFSRGNTGLKLQNGVYNGSNGDALNVTINNSTFSHNNYGILAYNYHHSLSVDINNSIFSNNGVDGIQAENADGITNILDINVNNTTFSGSDYGIKGFNDGAGSFDMTVSNSSFSGNQYDGIYAVNVYDGTFNMTVSNSTINNNSVGIDAANQWTGTMNIDYTGSDVSGNDSNFQSTGDVNWTPAFG